MGTKITRTQKEIRREHLINKLKLKTLYSLSDFCKENDLDFESKEVRDLFIICLSEELSRQIRDITKIR